MDAPNDDALDAGEVAQLLQVSRNTVYNLAKEGTLASFRIGRKMRFTRADVEACIQAARTQPERTISSPPENEQLQPQAVPSDATAQGEFLLSGTDMAADIVANYLVGAGIAVRRVYDESYPALVSMYEGGISAAIVNLYDRKTASYNVPYVQRLLPGSPVVVFHLVRRAQGFVVQKDNPKAIKAWDDVLRGDVKVANRPRGSAARILLDELLVEREAGQRRPDGYGFECPTALAAGSAVAHGRADLAIADERLHRQVDGLDFVSLGTERVDLAVSKTSETQQIVKFIRSLVKSTGLRNEFSHVPGYDARGMGEVAYEA